MPNVKIDKLVIRMRGVSRGEAQRAISNLAPALQRALATGTEPIISRTTATVRALPRAAGTLADRIATPLARALRGGSR